MRSIAQQSDYSSKQQYIISLLLANFLCLIETGFCHVGQAGLELLTPGDPPTLTSQSTGITGVSHQPMPNLLALVNHQNFKAEK